MKQILTTPIPLLLLLLLPTKVHSQCPNDLKGSSPFYPGSWVATASSTQKQTCLTDLNILQANNWLCDSIQFYPTLGTCCNKYYSPSEQENCLNPGGGGGPTPTPPTPTPPSPTPPSPTPPSSSGTNKWYVIHSSFKCTKDCPKSSTDPDCGGLQSWGDKFTTSTDCCNTSLSNVVLGLCESNSQSALPEYTGSNLWYTSGTKCVRDCVNDGTNLECGGVISERSVTMYDSLINGGCCDLGLAWLNVDVCKGNSDPNFQGTNMWYLDTSKGYCVLDSEQANCPTNDVCVRATSLADTTFHPTIEDCCDAFPYINKPYCQSSGLSTEYYYPNPINTVGNCIKDSTDANACGTEVCAVLSSSTYNNLYETVQECCELGQPWINLELCVSRSSIGVYTDKWFALTSSGDAPRCVKDCDSSSGSDPACGNVPSMSTTLYDDVATCCSLGLSYISEEICKAKSERGTLPDPTGTNLWYEGDDFKCVQDCAVGTGFCGGIVTESYISLYDDTASCCANELGSIDTDLCVARSTDTFSNKFYVDYQKMICYQNCDSGALPCSGTYPEDLSTVVYDTLTGCCEAKLSWIRTGICEADSQGVEYTGSGLYYINWDELDCVPDAPPNLAQSWVWDFYPTKEACCMVRSCQPADTWVEPPM